MATQDEMWLKLLKLAWFRLHMIFLYVSLSQELQNSWRNTSILLCMDSVEPNKSYLLVAAATTTAIIVLLFPWKDL